MSDNTVISPQSLTITPNLLAANFSTAVFELINCINGAGTGCTTSDGPGIVHSAVTAFGPPPQTTSSSGTLFTITYKVIGGINLAQIHPFNDIIVNGATGAPVDHTTLNGQYGVGSFPVAEFTWTALDNPPLAGEEVTFNASLSHDPDPANSIVSYQWDFSNLLPPPPSPKNVTSHVFQGNNGTPLSGQFQVTLTVKNNKGITASITHLVTIVPAEFHDIAVIGFTLSHDDDNILPGTILRIGVEILNNGTFPETGFTLNLTIDSQLLGNQVQFLTVLDAGRQNTTTFVWDTTGKAPASYVIHAALSPPLNATTGAELTERNTRNNQLSHWIRIIYPAGASLIPLTMPAALGLAIIVLLAVGGTWSTIRRASARRKRSSEDMLQPPGMPG
jgi:hypothetical protein